jgi:hypothetical protein
MDQKLTIFLYGDSPYRFYHISKDILSAFGSNSLSSSSTGGRSGGSSGGGSSSSGYSGVSLIPIISMDECVVPFLFGKHSGRLRSAVLNLSDLRKV